MNRTTIAKPELSKNIDAIFSIFHKQDGQIGMGSKVVQIDGNTFTVDDTEYKLTPGLRVLISSKHPRPDQWKTDDYQAYKELVAQIKVRSSLNRTGNTRPHTTWKCQNLPMKMVIPAERIPEESEDGDDTDTASIGAVGESSDVLSSPGIPSSDYGIPP